MESQNEDKVDFVVVEHLDRLHATQQLLLCDVTQVKDRVQKLEQAQQRDHQILMRLDRERVTALTSPDPTWMARMVMMAVGLVSMESLLFGDTGDLGSRATLVVILVMIAELLWLLYINFIEEDSGDKDQDGDSSSESEGEEDEGEADDKYKEAGDVSGPHDNSI